jgi:hypothetical protein
MEAARARAQAHGNGFAQQPPTGPRADRQQPPPKGELPTNGATPDMFSMEPKHFQFPESDREYAWRRLDELAEKDFLKVVRKFMRSRKYRRKAYQGLEAAIEDLWPDFRTECH